MRRTLAVISMALVACAPKVGPDLRKDFPSATEALYRIEPACRKPTPYHYEGCRRAAMMLDSDAPRATAIFLATWENVERHRANAANGHGHVGHTDLSGIGEAGVAALVVLPILAVGLVVAGSEDQRKRHDLQAKLVAENMTLRVLRKIYETTDDEYSRAMRPLVGAVRFDSPSSLTAFTTAHMISMQKSHGLVTIPGKNGGTTFVPPGSDATLADAAGTPSGEAILEKFAEQGPYVPKGAGPVPLKPLRDRWKVVEKGDRVELVTAEGMRLEGKVVACSERALAIQPRKPKGAAQVIVEAQTIAKLSVR